jgi:chaperonin GroEL (HSP60 family)
MKLDKPTEDQIKKHFDNYAEALVKNMITFTLKHEGLYEKWNDKAFELIKNVITNVFPSISDLNDSLNINEYVKIKKVIFHDQSLTKYIHGYALQKNVCFKKMKTRINEPKILMLEDCGNDLITNGMFRNTNEQQIEYLKIIINKIENVNPDLVLVSSNVPYRIQEILAKNERTLVMKMKPKSLKRIARVTKTYILPSTDLVDSQVIMGKCTKFYVERYEHKYQKESSIYNLMVFENSESILGCTIILSGPDKLELDKVKKVFHSMIVSARDILLQKTFLYFSFYNPLTIESENKNKSVSCKANFTFISDIPNRNTCVYNKYEKENTDYFQSFNDGFDTSYTHFQPNFYLVKLTFVQENLDTSEGSSSFNQYEFTSSN